MKPQSKDAGACSAHPVSGGAPGGGRPHLLFVEARFYADISDALLAGAIKAAEAAGASWERVAVPGALEIPPAIALAAEGSRLGTPRVRRVDGFVALGCVIRGETSHYELVCGESARGITELGLRGIAIGNGILTVENEEQAWERADAARLDKGGGAALAALALVALRRRFLPAHGTRP